MSFATPTPSWWLSPSWWQPGAQPPSHDLSYRLAAKVSSSRAAAARPRFRHPGRTAALAGLLKELLRAPRAAVQIPRHLDDLAERVADVRRSEVARPFVRLAGTHDVARNPPAIGVHVAKLRAGDDVAGDALRVQARCLAAAGDDGGRDGSQKDTVRADPGCAGHGRFSGRAGGRGATRPPDTQLRRSHVSCCSVPACSCRGCFELRPVRRVPRAHRASPRPHAAAPRRVSTGRGSRRRGRTGWPWPRPSRQRGATIRRRRTGRHR